jgi:hypothetical protein
MKTVTVHKAKTTLSQLIADVEAGEEVVLMRGKCRSRSACLEHSLAKWSPRRRFSSPSPTRS